MKTADYKMVQNWENPTQITFLPTPAQPISLSCFDDTVSLIYNQLLLIVHCLSPVEPAEDL